MNRKISLGLALALIFLAIAGSVAATAAVTMRVYNSIIKDLPSRTSLYSTVSEIDDIVRNNYFGEINDSLLNADLSEGYASGIGDRYSYYMTAAEYAVYLDEMQGQMVGVGANVFYDPTDAGLYVSAVSENSPAALAGLQKGDRIVSINEEAVTAYNYTELMENLTGDRLSSVTVTFSRDGASQTVNLVKGYTAQTVFTSLNGTVGYVQITAFYATTASQLEAAVETLSENGATGLIFDLRGCSAGTIEYAANTLDVLVPVASEGSGALATAYSKDGSVRRTFTAAASSVSMSMMVLINGETAGPAELFACDLRDYGMARLIGETTAGNGCLQEVFALSDGGAIILTTAEIHPYISESYNQVGIVPDEEVVLSSEKAVRLPLLEQSDDDQYQRAYSLLTGETEEDTAA